MPSEPSPNDSIRLNAMNQWDLDNRSAFANGAAGSIAPQELWSAELRAALRSSFWWNKYLKQGVNSPIRYEKRPGGGKGAIVHLRSQGQLGGPGKKGDQLFAAAADFGKIPLKSWPIYLDMISQATGVSRHTTEMLGLMDELERGIPGQLGDWGGFTLNGHVNMALMHKAAATSRSCIGGKTVATLKSADTPSWDAIQSAASNMRDQGGRPFRAGKMDNGEEIFNLLFPLPDVLATSVKRDPGYKQRVSDAGVRGMDNTFFKGGIMSIDGNQVESIQTLLPQGQLPAGSPWAPIAYLGVAHVAANTGVTALQGGGAMYEVGVTNTRWFEYFPGYTYEWNLLDSLTVADSFWGGMIASAGPFYALVVNPNTGTDAGKVGMIKYTVGTGANTLVIAANGKLSATNNTGVNNNVSIGDVTVATLEAAGASFTEDYQVGAAIIPCNAAGVPIGAIPAVGSDAMGLVRGDLWGDRFREKIQGGMSGENVFAGWTFGMQPYLLPNGFTPSISITACAVSYQGRYNLPIWA